MSASNVFGIDTIATGITRTNTCSQYAPCEILVINNKLFLVNEECPESEGTCTLVLIDISSGSPQKTVVLNGTNYNRTNLIGLRVLLPDGTLINANGYGEAFGNSECPEKGDLWLFKNTDKYHLCSPYGNTGGGNIYNPLLDGILDVILTGGVGSGWFIQKWDYKTPQYLDAWQVEDSSTGIWMSHLLYDNDTDTYYLITSGKNKTAPNTVIYKVPSSVIRDNWKSTQYLVNASGVEKLLDTGYTIYDNRSVFVLDGKIILKLWDSTNSKVIVATIDKSGNMETLSIDGYSNILSGYYILYNDKSNNVIHVYDPSLNEIDQISFDFSTYMFTGCSGSDMWITTRVKLSDGSYDIIGITYNGHIPYIEISDGTIYLKDFKTGDLLKGTLLYYETDVATGQIVPLGTPETLSISGSVPVPSSNKKFIQLYVKEITGLA